MTKIAYVSSIKTPGGTSAATVTPSKGTAIAPPQYINYIGMSEAELLTTLGRENMRILVSTYPTAPQAAAWQRNIERADNFLKGHTVSVAGVQGDIEREFMGFLEYASTKPQAAVGKRGHNSRIGDIEFEDCGIESGYWDYDPDRTDGSMIFYPANPDYYNCLLRNARLKGIQDAINKYLEQSAHHVLYLFLPNLNDVPNLVAIKGSQHQSFVKEIQRLSGLSEEAVLLWIRNGVMRQNAAKGLGALTPEQSLNLMVTGAEDADQFDINDTVKFPRIGIDPVTVGLIVSLVTLFVKALAITFQFILALKEKDGYAFASTSLALLGTDKTSPNVPDFKTGGGSSIPCAPGYTRNAAGVCVKNGTTPTTTTGTGLSTKTMILLGGGLAAAAGLYFVTSDNKKS